MKRHFAPFLLLFLLLTSCENAAFKKFDENFADNRWMQHDVHHYEFELAEAGNYDLIIDFRHIYGMPFPRIPLTVTMVMPGKTASASDVTLELADAQGEPVSDCTGDICDFEQRVFTGKKLEAGKYKISVANTFDHEFLPNVLGLGIRVKKSE